MNRRSTRRYLVILSCALSAAIVTRPPANAASIHVNRDRIIVVNGTPAFPIGFTKAPPPDGKTPSGVEAYAELKTNGTVFHLVGPPPGQWGPAAEARLDHILLRSARKGLLTAISIPDLQALGPYDQQKADELRRVVKRYRNNPGLGFWKAKDEPAWGHEHGESKRGLSGEPAVTRGLAPRARWVAWAGNSGRGQD